MLRLTGIALLGLAGACGSSTEPSRNHASFTTTLVENVTATSNTGGGTFTATCIFQIAGTLTLKLNKSENVVEGDMQFTGTVTRTSATGSSSLCGPDTSFDWSGEVSGTSSNFTASTSRNFPGPFTQVVTLTFDGSTTGSATAGTFTYRRTLSGTNAEGTTTMSSSGTATVSVSFS
jgi:hypothetical protein